MTLTFDLWPWKPFQQLPLKWWIFRASFVEMISLSTEHTKWVLTRGQRGQRTDGQRMPGIRYCLSSHIVGGGGTKIFTERIFYVCKNLTSGKRNIKLKNFNKWVHFLRLTGSITGILIASCWLFENLCEVIQNWWSSADHAMAKLEVRKVKVKVTRLRNFKLSENFLCR